MPIFIVSVSLRVNKDLSLEISVWTAKKKKESCLLESECNSMEIITLNETSQNLADKYWMFSLMCSS